MNRKQKVVVWVGLLLIVTTGLYPPMTQETLLAVGNSFHSIRFFFGYAWIFEASSSQLQTPSPYVTTFHVETTRLLVQWAMACFVVGGLAWTLADTKAPAASKPTSSGPVESD
jgi:hypothetical protein